MNAFKFLSAAGPYPEFADKLLLYGQFVGSWDITSTWFKTGGERSEGKGEWHFAWILGGRGVQDVLFRSGATPDKFGTTVRCYDPRSDVWHISWMQPSGGEFVHLIGRKVGNRIVQESQLSASRRRERWTFIDITENSFLWRGESSDDNGVSWTLEQEMRARRRQSGC